MNKYKDLSIQSYSENEFTLLPIRFDDRYKIMKWRNEQIFHLRQDKLLSKEDQDYYFNNVVTELFKKNNPDQLLFSFLKSNKCVGYGGLVHIDWLNKNAEISFVMNTNDEFKYFKKYWKMFLEFIEFIAFDDLKLHKIYVYSFDLRPKLYEVLTESNYFKDAVLKSHVFINYKFIDVVIYSKIRNL